MARPADRRLTLTLKGDEFDPEFRSLLNKAAKKAGKTQAAFAAEALAAAARRVLTGTPEDNPSDTPAPPPPAVIERIEETDRRITDLAEQVRLLTEMQRKSLWRRITGR